MLAAMRTPASIAGHPIHAMLVPVPIGLWVFSLVADLVSLRVQSPEPWVIVARYTLVGGIFAALAAAVPGLIDLVALKDPRPQKTALVHMTLNVAIVALYSVNALLGADSKVIGGVPLALSVVAVLLLSVSGWLGGRLVFHDRVGVKEH